MDRPVDNVKLARLLAKWCWSVLIFFPFAATSAAGRMGTNRRSLSIREGQ